MNHGVVLHLQRSRSQIALDNEEQQSRVEKEAADLNPTETVVVAHATRHNHDVMVHPVARQNKYGRQQDEAHDALGIA